jgi:hypothetical protein
VGAAGPKPAPTLRRAAVTASPAPAPKRPHHVPHRDNRSGGAVAGNPRPAHRQRGFRPARRAPGA